MRRFILLPFAPIIGLGMAIEVMAASPLAASTPGETFDLSRQAGCALVQIATSSPCEHPASASHTVTVSRRPSR